MRQPGRSKRAPHGPSHARIIDLFPKKMTPAKNSGNIPSDANNGAAAGEPLSVAGDFETLLAETVLLATKVVDAQGAAIFELGDDSQRLTLRQSNCWPLEERGRTFASHSPVESFNHSPQGFLECFPGILERARACGLEHAGAVIISSRRRAFGLLCVYAAGDRQLDPDELSLIESLARMLGTAADHLQNENQLLHARKAVEAEYQRRAQYVELLKRIGFIANEAESIEEAFGATLDLIGEQMNWPVCRVYMRDAQDCFSLLAVWSEKCSRKLDPEADPPRRRRFAMGEGLVGLVVSTCCPQWVIHLGKTNTNPEAAEEDLALKPTFAFPVLIGRRVVAVMEFAGGNMTEPDREFLEVMAQVGTQLGRAVERMQAEAELRTSEERFRTIFTEAALGVALLDLSGNFLQINPAFERILGYTPAELLGSHFTRIFYDEDAEADAAHLEALVNGSGEALHLERRHSHKNGRPVWSDFTLSLIRDSENRPRFVAAMLQDVSDRKLMEKRISDLVIERERKLGRELHDGLGQQLVGVGMLASVLKNKLEAANSPESARVGEILQNVLEAHSYVRNLSKLLHPVEVEGNGLAHALQQMSERMQSLTGIQFSFHADEAVAVEDSNVATHLFHIAQESVTNCVRHAQASQIRINLERDGDRLSLQVRDNGVGFKSPSEKEGGLGLRTMRYRAGVIGATLTVGPAEDLGTLVACTLKAGKPYE